MFTDLVDSTALKSLRGDIEAGDLIARDRANVERLAEECSGRVIDWAGDGCFLTFEASSAAVLFGLRLQQKHAEESDLPAVRIGIHMGEVSEKEGPAGPEGPPRVEGLAVDLAARVQSLAEPGQVLMTSAVYQSARQRLGVKSFGEPILWRAYGEYTLKGVNEPVAIVEGGIEGLSPLTAPRGSENARPSSSPLEASTPDEWHRTKEPSDLRLLKRLARRPWGALSVAAIIAAIVGGVYWYSSLESSGIEARTDWAREVAVPQIRAHVEAEEFFEAFELAKEAEEYIPEDTGLQRLIEDSSGVLNFTTEPPGARVFYQRYLEPGSEWKPLGVTPIEDARIAVETYRWKIELDGYISREVSLPVSQGTGSSAQELFDEDSFGELAYNEAHFRLQPQGDAKEGMVVVDAGTYMPALTGLPPVAMRIEEFYIQRTEVTNEMYKTFIDDGGYTDPKFWKEPFVVEGRELEWEEAMTRLMDATERTNGPAGWIQGQYPEGQRAKHPVGGVSWYEAMAFAEYQGKSLPTIFHWLRAALPGFEIVVPFTPLMVPMSNFDSDGPVEVGSSEAMSPWGAFDMAGNNHEWCLNSADKGRFALGSSWREPEYMFSMAADKDPWDRSIENGFRCMELPEGESIPEELKRPFEGLNLYVAEVPPVGDEEFETLFKPLLRPQTSVSLDPKPIESEPYGDGWTHEVVTIKADYSDDDRIIIHLYLPEKNATPTPTVVYVPGINAVVMNSYVVLPVEDFDFLLRDGRAIVRPVLYGMYDRNKAGSANPIADPSTALLAVQRWSKDLIRVVDYLEQREDTATDNLAFMGLSMGSMFAPVFLSVEERFKVAVLLAGGLYGSMGEAQSPQSSTLTFARHADTPVLMINGRYDYIFPVEQSQKPFFEAFRAPVDDKRHVVYDSGHTDMPRAKLIKETLDWLSKYQPTAQ